MNVKNVTLITSLTTLLTASLILNFYLFKKDDNSFEYNLKCAAYLKEEEREIDDISNLQLNEDSIVSAPRVFYSPKLRSCLSTYIIQSKSSQGSAYYYIKNILDGDLIFAQGGSFSETVGGKSLAEIVRIKYENKLKELE